MARYRRRATNRLKVILTILILSLITTGVMIGLSKMSNSGKSGNNGDSYAVNTTAGESQDEVEEPEPEPVADPMPAEITDPSKLKVSWKTAATFDGEKAFTEFAFQNTLKNGTTMQSWIFRNNTPLKEYTVKSKNKISFGSSDTYSDLEGITTFRGNNYRDSASFGTRTVTQKKLEIVWKKTGLGAISGEGSYWPGTGWTGQPLIVHWSEDVRKLMNINSDMKSKDLVEVIYPTLDGNIYFLDLETGKPTRNPIKIGYPIKGTG